MSNWIPITTSTLNEAKVAALVNACSTAALAEGQEDRAPGIIQGVVDEIRNAVATCKSNRVDSDATTIPKALRRVAIVMILAQLKGAIEQLLNDDEVKELDRAERKLRDVAACKLAVDQPDTPTAPEIEGTADIETIAEGNMGNSREDLAGL